MTDLFIICRSLAASPSAAATPALGAFFAAIGASAAEPVIVAPEGLGFAAPASARILSYSGGLGVERHPGLFSSLRGIPFSNTTVLGTTSRENFEEIVLSCYLTSGRKSYLDGAGGSQDIAEKWQWAIRPDFQPREVRVKRLPESFQREYVSNVHKWLGMELHNAEYGRPKPLHERSPGALLYVDPRLAEDLVQHTFDLQIEGHGASFSTLVLNDGTVVHSADFYRAMANLVDAIPGVHSILDVGCGSGFLSCYLAGAGPHRRVVGVDAAAPRVSGARLHAELAGIGSVEFRQTSMDRLDFPDGSFDVVISSFALEQSGSALSGVIAELRRVARKYLVLFEPSTDYFPTLASMWNVPNSGWANSYFKALTETGLSYAVRPNLLSHYHNPGTVFVVDLVTDRNPVVSLPHIFRADMAAWPRGLAIE